MYSEGPRFVQPNALTVILRPGLAVATRRPFHSATLMYHAESVQLTVAVLVGAATSANTAVAFSRSSKSRRRSGARSARVNDPSGCTVSAGIWSAPSGTEVAGSANETVSLTAAPGVKPLPTSTIGSPGV